MKLIQKAILKKGDNFLILLRSQIAEFFPGHWDFPGGKLEKGEKPFIGIEREVFEETKFRVNALKVVGTYELSLNGTPYRFTVYSTKLISGDIKISQEHSEFRWATKEEILKLKIEPYMKEYFKEHS